MLQRRSSRELFFAEIVVQLSRVSWSAQSLLKQVLRRKLIGGTGWTSVDLYSAGKWISFNPAPKDMTAPGNDARHPAVGWTGR